MTPVKRTKLFVIFLQVKFPTIMTMSSTSDFGYSVMMNLPFCMFNWCHRYTSVNTTAL